MVTQQSVIQKLMANLDNTTLKGEAALDAAVDYATRNSRRHFTTIAQALDAMKNDIRSTNDPEKFLKNFCGIDLTNADTGAITGSDAGGAVTKTAASVVPESGALDTSFYGNSFTVSKYGITFYLCNLSETGAFQSFLNFNQLDDKQKYIWRALKTWWAEKSLDLIAESYGSNFGFSSSTLLEPKGIYFGFYNSANDSTADSGPVGSDKEAAALIFRVNMNTFSSINTSDPNGSNSGGDYLDMTIAHELTHCVMAANINYYLNLPQFIREGMAELTIGADGGSLNSTYMKLLANPSSLTALSSGKSLFDSAFDLTNTSTGDAAAYAGGFMFLRYLAKQAADNIIYGTAQADNINNTLESTTILAGSGNDTITNTGPNASILAGYGNDHIINTNTGEALTLAGSKSTIDGGPGNDYIENRAWADYSLILGGLDDDTILNRAANSTIYGGEGNDSIYNSTSNVSIHGGDGDDTISSYNSKVTILGGAGNDLILLYANAKEHTINAGDGADSIYSGGQVVSINAGAGNDYIHLYSNATKQTVKAGAGDDSIRSYNTNGVVYQIAAGEGNDTINGFASNDTISVSGSAHYSKETLTGGSVRISLSGGGSITLLDASDKTISVKGSTLFNVINNTTASKKITVGAGASSIKNSGAKVTILGASAVDSIWNYGATVSVNAGAGDDYVDNRGGKVTVLGGKGNDTLRNDTYNGKVDNVKLSGGDGNDSLSNWGDKVTLLGGAGSDTLNNYANGNNGSGKSASMSGGDGNDSLSNWGDKVTMSGGAGSDTIRNNKSDGGGKSVKIYGGDDNDKIVNFGTNSTLNGGAGADTIENYKRGYLNGELAYEDGGHDVTIIGGKGNDLIKNVDGENVLFIYETGNGNDTLQGFNATSKLEIDGGSGSYTFKASNENFVFTIGKGKVTVQDVADLTGLRVNSSLLLTDKAAKNFTADSTTKALNASARTAAIKITGNSLANTLRGSSKNDSLYGGDGNDKLYGNAGNDKLYGQAGNDYLSGGSGNDYLSGAAGNDSLLGGAGNDTLIGGTGNDSLWGGDGADKFVYHNDSDNGKDVIFGFGSKDKLTLDNLDFTSSYKNDILTLNFSDGSITFRDFDTTTFHINSSTYKLSGSKLKKQ